MVNRKDRELIALLQTDSRLPVSEIARRVGMSENGVRYRLEKLEEAGYIRSYTALLNPRKFGMNVTALFHIKTSPRRTGRVLKVLQSNDALQAIYRTTGSYSILAIGLFKDIDALNAFVEGALGHEDILEHAVDVVTKKVKDTPFSL